MKRRNERKGLVLAIVLLMLVIAGMILRQGASAKEEEPEEKGAYAAHWMYDESDKLEERVVAIMDDARANNSTSYLYGIEWNEGRNAWELTVVSDTSVTFHYIYDQRFSGKA